jgi:hypothetical protein
MTFSRKTLSSYSSPSATKSKKGLLSLKRKSRAPAVCSSPRFSAEKADKNTASHRRYTPSLLLPARIALCHLYDKSPGFFYFFEHDVEFIQHSRNPAAVLIAKKWPHVLR